MTDDALTTKFTEQSFANILPAAIVTLDAAGKVLWWNAVAQSIFDLEPQHEGGDFDDVLAAQSFDVSLETLREGPVELTLAEKEQSHIQLFILPYAGRYVIYGRDISHLHQLENVRQDFVANVSHELRTPLTVIHGFLETMLDHESEELAPWHAILSQMLAQSMRMEQIIDDLLLLSRLENYQDVENSYLPINVPNLLRDIIRDAQALSGEQNHQISLEVDENLFIQGINNELRSAFSNIVFNAIKYTPQDGRIAVYWKREDNEAVLQVHDTGIGIAKKDIPRLSERFYRVDKARSRASGGTGLGLAIVKHVLIRHHAQLRVTSTLGKGSCFSAVFPEQLIIDLNT